MQIFFHLICPMGRVQSLGKSRLIALTLASADDSSRTGGTILPKNNSLVPETLPGWITQ